MGEVILGVLGFGLGIMLTVWLAHLDCADGEMITPWSTFQCTEDTPDE